jgi:hypothetical protein
VGSYLLDGGRWSDLSQNFLGIPDQSCLIACGVGSLPITGLLLFTRHLPILEPEGRCGIEGGMWSASIKVDNFSIYGTIAQA